MDLLTFISEVIDSVVWPVLIVAVLLMFWRPLWNAIGRIRSAGPGGVTLDPQQVAGQVADPFSKLELKILDTAAPAYKALLPMAREVWDNQSAVRAKASGFDDLQARSAVASEYVIDIALLRLYIMIFKSQYDLILHILSRGTRIPIGDAEAIFDEAKVKFPEVHQNRSFDEWLFFLINFGVVRAVEGMIEIREIGEIFPGYLSANRYAPPAVG